MTQNNMTIYLDVDKFIAYTGNGFHIEIENITQTNNNEWIENDTVMTGLTLDRAGGIMEAQVDFDGIAETLNNSAITQLYENNNGDVVIDDHILIVKGDFYIADNSLPVLIDLINKGVLSFRNSTQAVTLFTYRLNSERNVVNKSLVSVGILTGNFHGPFNIKSPTLIVQDFKLSGTFNYIYIVELKRYYYVQNIELTTNKLTTLALMEDVLMSFKDLILLQDAYILRSETTYDDYLNDNRRVIHDDNIFVYYDTDLSSIFSPLADGQVNYELKYVITVFRG